MVKRFLTFVVLVAMLATTYAFSVNAADSNAIIGRTYVYKPKVNIELYNVKKKVNTCSVELGNEELTVDDFNKYNSSKHKSVIYIVIDKSGSNYKFEKMKPALCKYVDKLTDNDTVVLVSFGKKVSKPTTYKSCTLSNKAKIKSAINSIVCNESGTLFYEAMKQVYNMSETENETYDRRYAIVATDGEDYQKGNATVTQVEKLYKSHLLPVFTLCHSSKNGFDALSDFCSISGGKVYKYSDSDSNNVINRLYDYVNKDVLLIEATSSSNIVSKSTQDLSVELNGKAVQSISIPVKSLKDTDSPTAHIIFDENDYYKFEIEFSEKVKNADDVSKYKVIHNGEVCEVSEVKKNSDTEYVLTMKDPVTSGDYAFIFDGITDISVQKNNVETVTITDLTSNKHIIDTIIFYGVIILAVLVVAGLVILFILLRKKKTSEDTNSREKQIVDHYGTSDNDIQHRVSFEKVDGVDIALTITKPGTATQIIKSTVCGSLMVGRADICDICIDDNQMSRQHFALEEKNAGVIITDLETLNGTFVNSFKLISPQKLKDGDEIIAGSCKIKFHYMNGER